MNVQEVSLDISLRRGISPEVYLGQDDSNATTLVASVFDGAAPFDLTGYTVRFCMRLPDGIHYYSVVGEVDGNVATFDIDETYAGAVHGTTDVAYVEISDGDDLVASTSRMCVIVLRGAQAGATPGEAYISEIEEAVEQVDAAIDRLDEAVEEAEEVIEHGIPLMSASTRGGAMLGTGLDMTGEVLSVDVSAAGGIPASQKGAANGVASLDPSGLVPSGQLPSYVDDVIEGYYYNGAFYEESTHETPIVGETGKIYVDLSTDTSYRWSGNAYISISNPIDIATEAEALAGNDNTKMMTPLRVKQVVTGDIAPNSVTTGGVSASSVTSSGEVTATKTVGSSTVTHDLTDKLDESDYLVGLTWDTIAGKYTWDELSGQTSTPSDTTTPNLGLTKPGGNSHIDVSKLNGNMDIIDAAVDSVKWNAQGIVLAYPGRNIADIPEIAAELETAGSVPAFLNARALAEDSSYLRVGDYVDITHSSIGGTRRYRIGDFWPYAGAGDSARPGGILMVSDRTWPDIVKWASKGNNNGNSTENCPYVCSDNTLHAYELNTILPTFPTAWQNVMQNHRALIESRYSSSSNLSAANAWAWKDLGKIWSPSETEVYGQVVWGTANGYSVGFDCQFEIFRKTRNRIKTYDGTNRSYWWLRSANGSDTTHACSAGYNGDASYGSVTSASIRPLPCFFVGAN